MSRQTLTPRNTLTPTPTAHTMIGTYTLRMESHDASAGLCVTFGGVVVFRSSQLKPTALSTTKLRNEFMIDSSNGRSRRMVIWENLTAWHGLASAFAFCLQYVCCLFFSMT